MLFTGFSGAPMRFTHRTMFAAPLALAAFGLAPDAALACSSCGCTLSNDMFSQGGDHSAFHADLRFDYFNQDQLRTGTGKFDRGSAEIPNDRELQQETINRNYNLFLDYAPNADWGFAAQIPYFDRYHTTIAPGDEDISTSHTKSIGDVRLLARYRGLSADRSAGLLLGVKLATGSFHNNFIAGPQEGEPLDRGLQPGTGTTDLLIGGYTFGAVNRDWDYFAEAILQQPFSSREDFRPGTGLNVTLGARYVSLEGVTPQIQVNMRTERRETGLNADVENSGATLVYFSPGVTVKLTPRSSAYAFLQLPIYQRVNGLQIESRYSVSFGIRFAM
jgi:hypothetical protein